MNLTSTTSKLARLLGTTSLLTTLGALASQAGETAPQVAQTSPEEIPENVLITGSLIHGTAAVGVPVTNLTPQDFAITGAVKIGDLFKDIPQANVASAGSATYSGGHLERETRVNLRGLDQTGPRSLMMVDGMRFPPQADGICAIDPSIIPAIALDHIDVLADGASATYGSDAIAGVINVILKRNYDGAQTQIGFSSSEAGKYHYLASQLWGRTWDGGQITLSYEWYDDSPVYGTQNEKYTMDYSKWGLDNRIPVASSIPGTISPGAVVSAPGTVSGTNCINCVAVPIGAGTNFLGGVGPATRAAAIAGGYPILDWTSISVDPSLSGAINGARNVTDPLRLGWEDAAQQRNAAVMTVDQRLTKDISFFGEAFYSNRRGELLDAPNQTPTNNVAIAAIPVPTWNPYYPINAPTNLRVSYDLGVERPAWTNFYELSIRYAAGLNFSLPSDWNGQIYYSMSADSNDLNTPGAINKNAISAALGWTIAASAAAGTTPGIATWAKPGFVPYLNLFCDPSRFACNSPDTLSYISALRYFDERMSDSEKGVKVDGPLFDLPAGSVKAAFGATYTGVEFHFLRLDNTGASSLVLPYIVDGEPYNVWAAFGQVNIPVFGDANALPLFRRLDLEASWRHDQYNGTLSGGTSNPKVGFTWELSEDAGVSLKGSWGTSFRFANAGEYSTIASTAIGQFNLPTSLGNNATVMSIACNGGAPAAGSGAAKLLSNGGSSVWGCNSQPFGISEAGGPYSVIRPGIAERSDEVMQLKPEQAMNYAIGAEFAPTAFLKGLDIQATYYVVRIAGVLTAFNNQNGTNFNNPAEGFHWIVPSDLTSCKNIPNVNAHPALCPSFENMVFQIISLPGNSVIGSQAQTSIYFINDGGTVNNGVRKVDGIDWSVSYDWDMGNIGAFNTGMTGTYYIEDYTQNSPGGPITDRYSNTVSPDGSVQMVGVPILPRMHYRARLGWSNGPWSITGFVDYQSHYFHTQGSPPNVNNQCGATPYVGGGTNPCAINNYSNIQPPWYSFDLSTGYDTGDLPANDYLKHIGLNFVIQNILGKHPAFQYGPSNAGRSFAAYDILKSDQGRVFNLLVTKTW